MTCMSHGGGGGRGAELLAVVPSHIVSAFRVVFIVVVGAGFAEGVRPPRRGAGRAQSSFSAGALGQAHRTADQEGDQSEYSKYLDSMTQALLPSTSLMVSRI